MTNKNFVVIDCQKRPMQFQRFHGPCPLGVPMAFGKDHQPTAQDVENVRLGEFDCDGR